MKVKQKIIRFYTVLGQPMHLDGLTITPRSRVLTLQLPFGGFVWNRASAVLVEQAGTGKSQQYRLFNANRFIQMALLGSGLAFTAISFLVLKQKTEKRRKES